MSNTKFYTDSIKVCHLASTSCGMDVRMDVLHTDDFLRTKISWKHRLQYFHVAKYHFGKVKLERVGQRSSSTSVCDLRGGPQGIAGLLVCPFASVALHCSFAC